VGEYAVNVTQLATRGVLGGAGVLPNFAGAESLTIDADNDRLGITVDGVDLGIITLTRGSYDSGDDLAAEIQARINSAASAQSAALGVTVTYSAGSDSLTLTSDSYGAESSVEISSVGINTAAELGLSVSTGTAGSDMIGTINGQAATASGQILTGADGTAAEGLSLEIDTDTPGDLGSITFGRGLFSLLDGVLDEFLVADGLLENRSSGLQSRIDDIDDQRVALEQRLESIEARYRAQFGSLDLLLSQLQSTSEFLTQQLASLPGSAFQSDS
jgi:flagellar hook-associated protein 2